MGDRLKASIPRWQDVIYLGLHAPMGPNPQKICKVDARHIGGRKILYKDEGRGVVVVGVQDMPLTDGVFITNARRLVYAKGVRDGRRGKW